MLTLVIVIHSIVCILLGLIILMQSGRGGGLTEAFASAESVFGAQTSTFLVKGTTILASLFLVTCLSIAFLSSKKSQSIMMNRAAETAPVKKLDITIPIDEPTDDVQAVGENAAGSLIDIPAQEAQGAATGEIPTPAAAQVPAQ
jgi:preprotein translocase subunit SecG